LITHHVNCKKKKCDNCTCTWLQNTKSSALEVWSRH